MTAGDEEYDLTAVRRYHSLVAHLNSQPDLHHTLRAVVDGVLRGADFGVAAVYYRHANGTFEALAVAGPPDARATVLGQRLPADAFDRDLEVAEGRGSRRFVSHEHLNAGMVTHWIPSTEAADGPDAWHPFDALFVPLHAPTGQLVGMLLVDYPADGPCPGSSQCELLGLFAAQAGIAVDKARLREELQLQHDRLKVSEEAFRLVFDNAGVGMGMIKLTPPDAGRYLRVNQALCTLTGYTANELLSLRVGDITHPDDAAADAKAATEALADRRSTYRAEKRYTRADGSTVWVAVTTSVVGRVPGRDLHAISLVEDITTRRAAEQQLTYRAAHDPLTGLLNRQALAERLTQAIHRARRSMRHGAVLFCDLDGFKMINDRFGHQQGDTVLAAVAQRLAAQVRAVDTIARLGGDEFVIIAEESSVDDISHLTARLQNAVGRPLPDADGLSITVSIGVARFTEHTTDADAVLREADTAMYRAKRRDYGR